MRMVRDDVLMPPHEGAAANQVIDNAEDGIDGGPARQAAVVGVVLYGEATHCQKNAKERS